MRGTEQPPVPGARPVGGVIPVGEIQRRIGSGQRPVEKPRYTVSALQSFPVTRPSLWDQSTLEAMKTPLPLEGKVIHRNEGKTIRERLVRRGVSTLSTSELLSVSFHEKDIVPKIDTLLTDYSLQQLLNADIGELSQRLGEAKAAQLQATLEIARRLLLPSQTEVYQISNVMDVVRVVSPDLAFLDHEEMRGLYLDTKNQVVANLLLYQGTANSCVMRNAEILRPAVSRNLPHLILAHNHPSGDPTPSPEDYEVTKSLAEGARLLEIELLDHVIIGKNNRFTSLKETMRW